jgi:hypothetical protein
MLFKKFPIGPAETEIGNSKNKKTARTFLKDIFLIKIMFFLIFLTKQGHLGTGSL